jgi:hypothetical protein
MALKYPAVQFLLDFLTLGAIDLRSRPKPNNLALIHISNSANPQSIDLIIIFFTFSQ